MGINKFLAAAAVAALSTGAFAQVGNFVTKTGAELLIGGASVPLTNPLTSPYYLSDPDDAGAGYSASVVPGDDALFFQAGTMAARSGNGAKSLVEVSFDVTNSSDRAIDQFVSTIFESNFGFHVTNFLDVTSASGSLPSPKPACTGSNLPNCTPVSIGPGFSDFTSVHDQAAPFTLGYTSFAFEILQDSNVVGGLSGSIRLDRDENGAISFVKGAGFDDLAASLNDFAEFEGAPDRVHAFSWADTDFTADLNPIGVGETSTLTYRVTTESWSDVSFQGVFRNLIVAFSCFADPIGRGGSPAEAAVFVIPDFGASTCNDYSGGSSPYALKFPVIRDGRILFTAGGAPGIPEPKTWAMLIIGFGLIGASMRRRKSPVPVTA